MSDKILDGLKELLGAAPDHSNQRDNYGRAAYQKEESMTIDPEKHREDYRQAIEGIRAKKQLTAEAKKASMARQYVQARNELRAFEDAEKAAEEKQIKDLSRDLWGFDSILRRSDTDRGSTLIAIRDAQDRADKLKDQQTASALLARADRSGDEILARAIAARAHDAGFSDVLNEYAAHRPIVADAYQKLRQVTLTETQQLNRAFHRSITRLIEIPDELKSLDTGFGDHHIDALAKSTEYGSF